MTTLKSYPCYRRYYDVVFHNGKSFNQDVPDDFWEFIQGIKYEINKKDGKYIYYHSIDGICSRDEVKNYLADIKFNNDFEDKLK